MKNSTSAHQSLPVVMAMSAALEKLLKGFVLKAAYTLNKDELVLVWNFENDWWYVKVITQFQTCFLLSGDGQFLKPSNAQPCFEAIWGKPVLGVEQHSGNRSFSIEFDGYECVLKCYGALANMVLFRDGNPIDAFRKQITNDLKMPLALSIEAPTDLGNQHIELPTRFFVAKQDEKIVLVTAKPEHILFETDSVWLAQNEFGKRCLSQYKLQSTKKDVLNLLAQKCKKLQALVAKTEQAILLQKNRLSDEEIGHLLMANLHAFTQGMSEVRLNDFNNNPVVVKLKKDLNQQQNAAYYYRKAKLEKKQSGQLEQRLAQAQQELTLVFTQIEVAKEANRISALTHFLPTKSEQNQTSLFKSFTIDTFQILVGKNAANNDVLTQKHTHKNDMWLHAKDVAGSHVVVKHQAGKPFPPAVLEKAAELAAYYSKLKGSDWVPVSYTLKKYVRKRKGAAPGEVVLDKEEVLLVAPRLPYEPNQF